MAKLDITTLTRAADEALAVTENPLHRRILENYRRHAILEVTGNWRQIFTPEMTVEHPVYRLNADGKSITLDGYEQVSRFYSSLEHKATTVMVLEDEQIAVADWGFASEAWFHTYTPARFVPGGDPDKFYLRRQLVAIHWPYDRRGRMIGEHVYVHDAATETHEIPAHEYITIADAREKLLPLLRPLPEFQVV
jgi:hypothetical protein